MENIELITYVGAITDLFESHLLTISIILGIVSFLFGVIGVFSFIQVKKYIISKVENAVKSKIKSLVEGKDIEDMIEEEVSEQIKRYGLIVTELVDNSKESEAKDSDL